MVEKNLSAAASLLGKLGSKVLLEKMGPDYLKELAKRGAAARWKNHKKKGRKKVQKV